MLHSYQVMSFTASGNNGFTCSFFKGSGAVVSCKRKLAEVVLEPSKHNYCPDSAVRSSSVLCVVQGAAAVLRQLMFSRGKSRSSARVASRGGSAGTQTSAAL